MRDYHHATFRDTTDPNAIIRPAEPHSCSARTLEMAAQLSAVSVTRGIALKAPRMTAKKARIAMRVQAVRPREPRAARSRKTSFVSHGSSHVREPCRHPRPDHDPLAIRQPRSRLPRRLSNRSPPLSKSTSRCVPPPVRGAPRKFPFRASTHDTVDVRRASSANAS